MSATSSAVPPDIFMTDALILRLKTLICTTLKLEDVRTRKPVRPSADEVDWASRLLAAFDGASGMTIAFEGQMVDEVVAARARAILASVDAD